MPTKRKAVLINGIEDPSMPNPNRSIDREWFIERIKHCKLTQRTFAQQTGLHLTSVIRLLGGKRMLKLDEVPIVAHVLHVPIAELLERAGMDPNAARNTVIHAASTDARFTAAENRGPIYEQRTGDVPIIGYVDGELNVQIGHALGRQTVPPLVTFGNELTPYAMARGPVYALRMQTFNSPYSGLDGGVIYYNEVTRQGMEGYAEVLCVVELEDGRKCLRVIHRGYGPGLYNLSDIGGKMKETEVRLVAAHPVVHILLGGMA